MGSRHQVEALNESNWFVSRGRSYTGFGGESLGMEYRRVVGRAQPEEQRSQTTEPAVQATRTRRWSPWRAIDRAVTGLVLETVTPASIDVAVEVFEELPSPAAEVDRAKRAQIARLREDAELAQRQFLLVRPQNRLVADNLERHWNDALQRLAAAEEAYAGADKTRTPPVTPEPGGDRGRVDAETNFSVAVFTRIRAENRLDGHHGFASKSSRIDQAAGFACASRVVGCLDVRHARRRPAARRRRRHRDQAEVIAKAIHDGLEHGDHVTFDQFRTGLADALMKFCRGLFATTNLIYLSRQIPLLREPLIVLLSGGYDRVDMEALVAASAARPEVSG